MNNQDSCQLYKNQGVYLDGGRVVCSEPDDFVAEAERTRLLNAAKGS